MCLTKAFCCDKILSFPHNYTGFVLLKHRNFVPEFIKSILYENTFNFRFYLFAYILS